MNNFDKATECYNKYLGRAIESFNRGFNTKTAQKEAKDNVGRAFGFIRDFIMKSFLDKRDVATTNEEKEIFNTLYWVIPSDAHQLRDRHIKVVSEHFNPSIVRMVKEVSDLYQAIKCAEVVKIEKEPKVSEKERAILSDLDILIAKLQGDFDRGINLSEKFGGLQFYNKFT